MELQFLRAQIPIATRFRTPQSSNFLPRQGPWNWRSSIVALTSAIRFCGLSVYS